MASSCRHLLSSLVDLRGITPLEDSFMLVPLRICLPIMKGTFRKSPGITRTRVTKRKLTIFIVALNESRSLTRNSVRSCTSILRGFSSGASNLSNRQIGS